MDDGQKASGRARRTLVERLVSRGVYLVTDDALDDATLLGRLKGALEAGVDVVQWRSKRPQLRASLTQAERVRDLCRRHGALFIVNDRADIAAALSADGLHVGQDDLPAPLARRVIGDAALLGVSASLLDEARAVDRDPAIDYLGFGAMFPTPTKPDAEYAGPELLRAVRREVHKPIVAIGGIGVDNAHVVLEAGADCIAVVSAVFGSGDARPAAAHLLRVVAAAHSERPPAGRALQPRE
jgi:thiamine-phosphate diphosphorylase